MKIIVIAGLIAVIASLFSALYFLYRDRGRGDRMVKALAIRVGLSATLVIFLVPSASLVTWMMRSSADDICSRIARSGRLAPAMRIIVSRRARASRGEFA